VCLVWLGGASGKLPGGNPRPPTPPPTTATFFVLNPSPRTASHIRTPIFNCNCCPSLGEKGRGRTASESHKLKEKKKEKRTARIRCFLCERHPPAPQTANLPQGRWNLPYWRPRCRDSPSCLSIFFIDPTSSSLPLLPTRTEVGTEDLVQGPCSGSGR